MAFAIAELRRLALQGLNITQIAERLETSAYYVRLAARDFDIEIRRGRMTDYSQRTPVVPPVGKPIDKRAAKMAELYKSGQTLQNIGDQYGLSRERIRQILWKYYGIRTRVLSPRAAA